MAVKVFVIEPSDLEGWRVQRVIQMLDMHISSVTPLEPQRLSLKCVSVRYMHSAMVRLCVAPCCAATPLATMIASLTLP